MGFVFYCNLKQCFGATAVLALLSLLLSGCPRPADLPKKAPPLAPGALPTITVIAGGMESYWNQARRGAEAAGKKFNAKIVWKVPAGQDKDALIKSQQKLIEDAIDTSQGMVVAPVDSTELMRSFREVALAGLPIVAYSRDVYTIQNKLSYIHNDDDKMESLSRAAQPGKGAGVLEPDYYQMGYQGVKVIFDYRALKEVPREIRIAPRLVTENSVKTLPPSKAKPK